MLSIRKLKMIYVVLYLAAIVIANILILLYNPETVSMTLALVAETGISFFLIGLDLSVRDKFHDFWKNLHIFCLIYVRSSSYWGGL